MATNLILAYAILQLLPKIKSAVTVIQNRTCGLYVFDVSTLAVEKKIIIYALPTQVRQTEG